MELQFVLEPGQCILGLAGALDSGLKRMHLLGRGTLGGQFGQLRFETGPGFDHIGKPSLIDQIVISGLRQDGRNIRFEISASPLHATQRATFTQPVERNPQGRATDGELLGKLPFRRKTIASAQSCRGNEIAQLIEDQRNKAFASYGINPGRLFFRWDVQRPDPKK